MTKNKVVKKNKKKTKKTIKQIGKKEFVFNLVSLVIVLGIALYFGGRSLYYYSLQNAKTEAKTLSGLVLANNKIINEGDGLHQTEAGYFFKGNVENNYVWFANRMFRVLGINDDESIKLVSENYAAIFMWGEKSNYNESNLRMWLTKTNKDNTGIYYNTIPSQKSFLIKTSYTEDKLDNDKVVEGKEKLKEFVTTLTITDYTNAGGKNSFLNNGKLFYIIGHNTDDENLYVEEDGSVVSTDSLSGYGIRPVITLNGKVTITQGDGSQDNPFVVDMRDNNNYVDSYVKLGNDIYKVMENKDNKLKMYKTTYLNINGEEVFSGFHNYSVSRFDPYDGNSIGYYLNNDFFNSLSYKDILVDNDYYNGYINEEVNYDYLNNYSSHITCRIGLVNIFDYNSSNELNDYYHINTISDESTMVYSTYSNGLLFEDDINELKHIVPVVSINVSSIKSGSGRNDDPYIAG